ncbi:hypothetical protein FJT64_020751 [Amphibalanus amphitrite]|uniref:BED-type domain-containing protein n=1 Tax=Amphibalanus amphitrite TaxID=1232801 RepID=A0A6A4WKQ6_AMPAM|nr:hypothetical protein FJT64_020751 [Amphibalanus amphitrite]
MAAYRPGRSKAKEWDLFEEIEDPNKVRCKQCETEVSKKIERVRVHLEKCRNSKRRRDDAEDEQDVEEPTTAPKLDKWVVRTTGAMKKKLDEQYARGIYAGTNKKTAQCIAQLADEEIKRCEKEYGCTVVGYISDNEAKMVAVRSQLSERNQQLSERDQQLSERDQQLSERDQQLRDEQATAGELRRRLKEAETGEAAARLAGQREAAAAELQSQLYNQKVELGEQQRHQYDRLLSSHLLSCRQVELGEQQRKEYDRLLSYLLS